MANGVLGLGSGQAASLNSDLIEKLKTAERKSTVEPIETKITNITGEKETFSSIKTKVSELLEAIKPFDLFVSGGVTAFGQKSATTSGDSVTFDAADLQALPPIQLVDPGEAAARIIVNSRFQNGGQGFGHLRHPRPGRRRCSSGIL